MQPPLTAHCTHTNTKKSLLPRWYEGKKALFDRNNIRHHGGAAAAFRGQQQQVGLPCERLEEDKFCGGHRGYKSCLCSPSEMIRSLAVEWSCALRQNENNSERAPGRIV